MNIKIVDLDVAEVIDTQDIKGQDIKGATGWYPSFYADFFKRPFSSTASATATSTAIDHSNRPSSVFTQTLAVTLTSEGGSYARSSSTAATIPNYA